MCHRGEAKERRGAEQEGSEEVDRSHRVHRDKEDAPVKKKAKSPPVKTKKMTNLEDKPTPRIVRKWVPKTAAPLPSVGPK